MGTGTLLAAPLAPKPPIAAINIIFLQFEPFIRVDSSLKKSNELK